MAKDLRLLENRLNVVFKDKDILRTALVHRSYLNEHKDLRWEHNERLEFLGDAVLELAVTHYLFQNYSDPEGKLTNWRSALVNATHLSAQGDAIGLYDFIYLSKGEAQDKNQKAKNYIIANAFEALIGAIYLDQGYAVAEEFVKKSVIINLEKIISEGTYVDAKSLFQEKSQELMGVTPRYRVLSEAGPDHHKHFVIGVYLDKELVAQGEGFSKQEAQVVAASRALEVKDWLS